MEENEKVDELVGHGASLAANWCSAYSGITAQLDVSTEFSISFLNCAVRQNGVDF